MLWIGVSLSWEQIGIGIAVGIAAIVAITAVWFAVRVFGRKEDRTKAESLKEREEVEKEFLALFHTIAPSLPDEIPTVRLVVDKEMEGMRQARTVITQQINEAQKLRSHNPHEASLTINSVRFYRDENRKLELRQQRAVKVLKALAIDIPEPQTNEGEKTGSRTG